MVTVAVTGSSGKLGRHVVHDLHEHGYRVVALDRVPDPAGPPDARVRVELTDHGQVREALTGGISAGRRTFTWLKPVVSASAIGPRDDTPTIPPLNCDECAVELTGDVWVLRELLARGSGGRRGPNDPRSRRTLTVCETCWGRLARAACTIDLPCGVCGRIRHCDASSNFGARFQALHACSPECARTARRRPVRFVVTLRCQWCGEAFTAYRRGARYCSVAHRKAAHHQARNST